jgi:hypothetical protein
MLLFRLYIQSRECFECGSQAMKTAISRTVVVSAIVLFAHGVRAQDMFKHIITSEYEDMAEIKRKAEAGDAGAQHKLANSLAVQMRSADALQWYSKAARQGDLDGFYQVGRMLLYGAGGSLKEQTVPANPSEGIRIVFRAATNGYHAASYDMCRAYKEGRGVAKDAVQAYAWLQLHVDTDHMTFLPSARRPELNQLALEVDVATSQEGKRLAALYRSGKWPELVVQAPLEPKPAPVASTPKAPAKPVPSAPPKPAPVLKLNSIAMGRNPVVMINGKMLGAGETATIPAKPEARVIKCLTIEKDSVLVRIGGETEPRRLWLR